MNKITTLTLNNDVLLYRMTREILFFCVVMLAFMVFLSSPGVVILIAQFHRLTGLMFVFVPVGGVFVATIVFLVCKFFRYSKDKKQEKPSVQKIEFSEKVTISFDDEIAFEYDYKDFFKATSSKNYYFLHFSKFKFFLLDKKDFSNADLNALQNKLKSVK
ncbi:MAG: YcxB family protein [Firmicutes bacterium]|nr:YcxB family protein [Bacillota bacterium]MCL2255850.1 YcxB family protein [Bacillota bacterium]